LPYLAIICQQVRHECAMEYAYYPPISIAPAPALNAKAGAYLGHGLKVVAVGLA